MSPLKSKNISDFVEFALLHDHWQQNRDHLQAEMEMCLQGFSESYRVRFDWDNIVWPLENQVVKIEDPNQIKVLLKETKEAKELGPDHYKIIPNRNGEMTTVSFVEGEGISVKVYPNLARINNGRLIPMVSQKLYYDQNLTFTPYADQVVQTDKYTYALFSQTNQGCIGKALRGYTFQKSKVFEGGGINRYPLIFYPVKRLEQTFINRKTDPMYTELVQAMEKSISLLRQGHPQAQKFAHAAFERGQLAFNEIFPDDKLFGVLLNSLEALLDSKQSEAESKDNHFRSVSSTL